MRTPYPTPHTPRPRRPGRRNGGFTLIEAALTTVIVGTGVLAMVAAQQAYHAKNGWAQRTGTAMLLANELRELTINMSLHDPSGVRTPGPEADEFTNGEPDVLKFDDIGDFAFTVDANNVGISTFSPPIDALGIARPDLEDWTQEVRLKAVSPDNLAITESIPTSVLDQATMIRVTVNVLYKDEVAATLTWVVPE